MTTDVRAGGRSTLGWTGTNDVPPLRDVVHRSGSGWYPLVALGGLSAVVGVGGYALTVLLPEISRSLGISPGGLTALMTLSLLTSAGVSLPLAGVVQRRPVRGLFVVAGGFASALFLLLTAVVVNMAELAAVMVASGAAGAVVVVSYQPLVVELYPPEGRVRALSILAAARGLGDLVAPVLVGGLVTVAGLTWRGVFVVAGVLGAVAAAGAVRLRDPGFGRWDRGRIRALLREGATADAPAPSEAPLGLGPVEAARQLHTIPTLRALFLFRAGLGAMFIPFTVFLVLFLDVRWNLGPFGRGATLSGLGLAAVVALALFGPAGERLLRRDPRDLVAVATRLYAAALVLVAVASFAPILAVVVVALALAVGLVAAIRPALALLHLSLVAPQLRSTANALAVIYFAGPGGVLGILLLGAADRRYGLSGALLATTVPGVAAVLLLRRARRTVTTDLDRVLDEAIEDEQVRQLIDRGTPPPLLTLRRLHAGYDDRTVLRDIDLTVEAGERMALLGVNGAGKTTLLRVVAGLLPPRSGTVRLRGRDVTYLEAERRSRLGIVLASGPATVFDPLTVDEHLRLYRRAAGMDAAAAAGALTRVDTLFPGLAARRGVAAGSLSGGERQMLGISRALIRRPDVLLVDELSSGLAPELREPLLEAIRALADEGTAVILVEQSLELALSVCERVVFLERGGISFDGPGSELLGRDDLVRPVFLPGASP